MKISDLFLISAQKSVWILVTGGSKGLLQSILQIVPIMYMYVSEDR